MPQPIKPQKPEEISGRNTRRLLLLPSSHWPDLLLLWSLSLRRRGSAKPGLPCRAARGVRLHGLLLALFVGAVPQPALQRQLLQLHARTPSPEGQPLSLLPSPVLPLLGLAMPGCAGRCERRACRRKGGSPNGSGYSRGRSTAAATRNSCAAGATAAGADQHAKLPGDEGSALDPKARSVRGARHNGSPCVAFGM